MHSDCPKLPHHFQSFPHSKLGFSMSIAKIQPALKQRTEIYSPRASGLSASVIIPYMVSIISEKIELNKLNKLNRAIQNTLW